MRAVAKFAAARSCCITTIGPYDAFILPAEWIVLEIISTTDCVGYRQVVIRRLDAEELDKINRRLKVSRPSKLPTQILETLSLSS